MENKKTELEERVIILENRIKKMEDTLCSILYVRTVELEKQVEELTKKQEKENTLVYEHLQFMNYSQKIKNLENDIRDIKMTIGQKIPFHNSSHPYEIKPWSL